VLSADELQFYFMHFMPYADRPADESDSVWVDYSNSHYDPGVGKRYYERYVDEMVLADRLGFDGLVVNEHHSSPYSMMPSCTVMASTLVALTGRAKICIFGTPVNLTYPNRLAEEYAMLDVMSGGRTELAFPLGTGMEYWSNANEIAPATARARYREALDVIRQAWTTDGPTTYSGRYYNYRYLNVWPKPFQQPHLKLYIMGSGSPGTIDLAAELGFGYSVTFIPITQQLAAFDRYRAKVTEAGGTPRADSLILGVMAYVADTDEEALEEGRQHILFYFNNMMRTTPRYLAPPGYVELGEYRRRIERMLTQGVHGNTDWETLTKLSRVVCGSPDTVANAIAGWVRDAGSSRVICHLHLGDMPHWKTVKNLTLFAEEVLPRVRRLIGSDAARAIGARAAGEDAAAVGGMHAGR